MSGSTLLIAQCGDTYPSIREAWGNFDDWFSSALEPLLTTVTGDGQVSLRVWNAHQEDRAPEAEFCGIIVTGSPAMVTDRASWSVSLGEWLADQVREGMPVLGVCYGHQLLADALGGEVDFEENGREIGSLLLTRQKESADDPLFSQLPASFYANLTHAQSVMSMPPGSVLLASSSRVRCQAFRFGEHAWGVQFHPEFSRDVMAAYLDVYHDQIAPAHRLQLESHLHECSEAASLISSFARYCLQLADPQDARD